MVKNITIKPDIYCRTIMKDNASTLLKKNAPVAEYNPLLQKFGPVYIGTEQLLCVCATLTIHDLTQSQAFWLIAWFHFAIVINNTSYCLGKC